MLLSPAGGGQHSLSQRDRRLAASGFTGMPLIMPRMVANAICKMGACPDRPKAKRLENLQPHRRQIGAKAIAARRKRSAKTGALPATWPCAIMGQPWTSPI
jgi:hypothetical protein